MTLDPSSEWARATRSGPCPVCGKDSWCTYTIDLGVVKCMRVASQNAHPKGGWLHFDDYEKSVGFVKPAPKPTPIDAERVAMDMFHDRLAHGMRQEMAKQLGVHVGILKDMLVGTGADFTGKRFASFPSWDESGKIVGITRRYLDGSKLTFPGSKNGVFYIPDWWEMSGVVLIVEGASDVAAAAMHGVCAIGRPSNVQGADIISQLLDRHAPGRPVLVVGENDENPNRRGKLSSCPSDCDGCLVCFPGRCGAEYVASKLGCGFAMPPYPYKDFREMSSDVVWLDALTKISVRNSCVPIAV